MTLRHDTAFAPSSAGNRNNSSRLCIRVAVPGDVEFDERPRSAARGALPVRRRAVRTAHFTPNGNENARRDVAAAMRARRRSTGERVDVVRLESAEILRESHHRRNDPSEVYQNRNGG